MKHIIIQPRWLFMSNIDRHYSTLTSTGLLETDRNWFLWNQDWLELNLIFFCETSQVHFWLTSRCCKTFNFIIHMTKGHITYWNTDQWCDWVRVFQTERSPLYPHIFQYYSYTNTGVIYQQLPWFLTIITNENNL